MVIPVKLLYLLFQFGNAFVIEKCLKYLETPADERYPTEAYDLIILSVVVYVGRAVSMSSHDVAITNCFRSSTLNMRTSSTAAD
jgi:hypothetical protein